MMRISDHALVRFLDRVAGLNVEGLRATLALSLDRAHRAAESVGAADYTVKADGLIYVVRDGVLVTVLGDRPAGGGA